jgi:hypothetical protein
MSANVVQLRMVRGRLVATERAQDECERDEVNLAAEVHVRLVRLVYCLAAWNGDGMAQTASASRM